MTQRVAAFRHKWFSTHVHRDVAATYVPFFIPFKKIIMIDYNHASNPQILLPTNLAGDKNVSDFAKLLYVQIHIDYTQYSFCVKTNKEFSAIFGKDPHTVSRSISQLVSAGYVMSSISATFGNSRVLYPNF